MAPIKSSSLFDMAFKPEASSDCNNCSFITTGFGLVSGIKKDSPAAAIVGPINDVASTPDKLRKSNSNVIR